MKNMPKYRDWDYDDEYSDQRNRGRKLQKKRPHKQEPDAVWDRIEDTKNKWNKKNPYRR